MIKPSNCDCVCGFCLWQISSAACGYGFTLIASRTKDVIKLWGMGLNKDSQLGFQRTQHSRRKNAFPFRQRGIFICCYGFSPAGRHANIWKHLPVSYWWWMVVSDCSDQTRVCSSQLRVRAGTVPGGPAPTGAAADPGPPGVLWPSSFAGPHRQRGR